MAKKMKKARKNVSNLDNELILLQDFKKFDHEGFIFGYSTVKFPFDKWVDREAKKMKSNNDKKDGIYLEMVLSDFRREYGLDFLIVNLKMHRKRFLILINCPIEKNLIRIKDFKPINYKYLPYYEVNVIDTRKIIVPIIKKLLNKLSEKSE